MISLSLAAGYATRLYPLTQNFPKPLLEVGGKSILDRMLRDIDAHPAVTRHVVVSNHRYIEHFRAWLERAPLSKPVDLIDDGSTCNENRLGAVGDILLAVEKLGLDDDLLVAAADNLLDFSLATLIDYAQTHQSSALMRYREPDRAVLRRCGVLTVLEDGRVTDMLEKPADPPSEWAAPPFYVYERAVLPLLKRAPDEGCAIDAPGSLMAWLCHRAPVYAMEMPGRRHDIGNLESYQRARALFGEA